MDILGSRRQHQLLIVNSIVYAITNSPIQTDMYFQPTMAIPATDPTDVAVPVAAQQLASYWWRTSCSSNRICLQLCYN